MLPEIESLLKRTMGLDAASIGLPAIERAVLERMSLSRAATETDYLGKLDASAQEMQALIEAVVVPETWFFRDREAFAGLVVNACGEWLRTHAEGTLRVLSLPCSTGEEPYSMVMALLDSGLPASRFKIDAVDISERAVACAKAAVYGKNSFRGGDIGFRDRYFAPFHQGWKLTAEVQRQVQFIRANLFDADFLPGTEVYDVIFCRNVLIYFDRPMQDRAVGVLRRLLTEKGFLFVGPSETGLFLSHDFESAKLPLAFAFRNEKAVPKETRSVTHSPARRPATLVKAPVFAAPVKSVPVPAPVVTKQSQPEVIKPAEVELDAIAELADQGRLADAARRCEEYLRANSPSARAFYLLGLVRDAAGNHAAAGEFYRKALYLDPKHEEALLHLAFLLEKQGDSAGAKILNQRARRAAPAAKV